MKIAKKPMESGDARIFIEVFSLVTASYTLNPLACFTPPSEPLSGPLKHHSSIERTIGVSAALAEAPRIGTLDPAQIDRLDVARTLRGDPNGFTSLVERYERPIYHLVYRMLRNADEAADVAQESFFKAYRALASFKPEAKFSTWLYAIAYHAAIDRINKRKRLSQDELPDRADPSAGPEQQAILSDQASRLRRAIDELPEKYRTVITLFHLQGKHYEEIAEVLGLPMGTVKTHLFRAKEQLRIMLENDGVTL